MRPGETCTFLLGLALLMSYGIAYAAGDVCEERVPAEVGDEDQASQKRSFNE